MVPTIIQRAELLGVVHGAEPRPATRSARWLRERAWRGRNLVALDADDGWIGGPSFFERCVFLAPSTLGFNFSCICGYGGLVTSIVDGLGLKGVGLRRDEYRDC